MSLSVAPFFNIKSPLKFIILLSVPSCEICKSLPVPNLALALSKKIPSVLAESWKPP